MWTALLGPFSVGVVRWRSPRPSLTVIVKVTLSLATDGPMPLAATQLALGTDATGSMPSDEELEYPSDFAPRKARAEVLVVGHAHAPMPRGTIAVAIETGAVSKRFEARAGVPAPTIPLASSYLRRAESAVRTAPRRADVPQWVGRSLPDGFDYGLFNVGPEDQWTDWLAPGQRIVLEGLLASALRREAELPALEPLVGYFAQGFDRSAAREVAMVADTLWIHADEELCTVVWRGTLERVPASSSAERLIVAPRVAQVMDWVGIRPRLADAVWTRAAQEADLPPGPPVRRPLGALLTGADGGPGRGSSFPPPNADDEEEPTVAQLPGTLGPSASYAERSAQAVRDAQAMRDALAARDALDAQASAGAVEEQPAGTEEMVTEEALQEEEPEPATPRAGLTLGRRGEAPSHGAQLGGVVLCAPPRLAEPLPYAPAAPAPVPPATVGALDRSADSLEGPVTRRGTGTLPPAAPPEPSEPPVRGTGTLPPASAGAYPAAPAPMPARVGTGTEPPATPDGSPPAPPSPAPWRGTGTLPPAPPGAYPSSPPQPGTGTAPPTRLAGASSDAAVPMRSGTGTLPPAAVGPPRSPLHFDTGTEPPAAPGAQAAPSPRVGDAAASWPDVAAAASRVGTGTAPPRGDMAGEGPRPTALTPLMPLIPRAPALPSIGRSLPPGPPTPQTATGPGETLRPPSPGYLPPAISPSKRAEVVAALKLAIEPRAAVLARHGLDDRAWRAEERQIAIEQLHALVGQPSAAPARDRDDGEQNDVAASDPRALELERFVQLKVRIDSAAGIEQALSEAGLTMADWQRTLGRWRAACRADRRLARRVRDELHRLRAAQRAAPRAGTRPSTDR